MNNPKKSTGDYALQLTKGALGAIPFAGAFVGELMEIIIVPQYQKKLEQWFEYVDTTLKDLIENSDRTKKEIFDDEEFQSIFQKTSRTYVNNFAKEKIPLLKSYFKSSLNKETEFDKKILFLEMIENLTVKHLMILRDLNDNEKSENYKYKDRLEDELKTKYAGGDKSYFGLLEKGLQNYHLVGYGSAKIVVENKNQWHFRTSKIGKELIQYITE